MKYNKHYKAGRASSAPRKSRAAAPRKNKAARSKNVSKEQAIIASGYPPVVDPQVIDSRKDKKKPGVVMLMAQPKIVDDQPKNFVIVDKSSVKTRKNPAKKSAEQLELETVKSIVANIDETKAGREKILASVAVQSIGGQVVMPMPRNPEAAYSLGLYQGIRAVKEMCPTYKIPGISLINKDAGRVLATIKARTESEKETAMEFARRGTGDQPDEIEGFRFTEQYKVLEPRSELRADLGDLKDRIPQEPFVAWNFGYRQGMQFGLEACLFKWVPFVPAFRKIKNQIELMERVAAIEESKQYELMQAASAADRAFLGSSLESVTDYGRRERMRRRRELGR